MSYNTFKTSIKSEANNMECYLDSHDNHRNVDFEEVDVVLFDIMLL